MKKTFILFISLISITIACKKTTGSREGCICTKRGCPCPELIISIRANDENSTNQESGKYTKKEIDSFYLIRTDKNFTKIDSTKLSFGFMAGNNLNYNRLYSLSQNSFPDFKNLREYNFLIKNTTLNSIDTISSVQYTEKMEHVFCNKCSNCSDEYVDCLQYSKFRLKYNFIPQNNFQILVKKEN